mgnify:CR=1 FL=1
MELKHKLLDHPFYQAWNEGEITADQLAKYHESYKEFIEKVPDYWQKIIDGFGEDSTFAKSVVEDERSHIPLWNEWESRLPETDGHPDMKDVIEALDSMTNSELLGAIHAFEIQQPEVAKTKKEGLLKHYNFTEEEMTYFDEHQNEEPHIRFGKRLAERFANQTEFQRGFDKGAEIFYNALDKYIN